MRNKITLFITMLGYIVSMPAQIPEEQSFSFDEISTTKSSDEGKVQYFQATDNTTLAYYHFITEKPAKASVVFIHGGGAHSKLGYTFLAQSLKEDFQIETYLLDLRGHGASEGRRGDSPKVKSMWGDIKSLIQMIKSKSSQPIYLAGHSSGAGLVLNYDSWKKKEAVAGYFFISPELGYKSNTEKVGRVPFGEVKLGKFIANGVSQGLLFAHAYAVFFNYPREVLKRQPLIVSKITVNTSKALTPNNPVKQFARMASPIGLFVGENDELFDTPKVLAYADLSTNEKTVSKLISDKSHLSILLDIGSEIGKTIEGWSIMR